MDKIVVMFWFRVFQIKSLTIR